jgi:hypothetical protein
MESRVFRLPEQNTARFAAWVHHSPKSFQGKPFDMSQLCHMSRATPIRKLSIPQVFL